MKDKKNEAIIALAQAYGTGNTAVTERIENILLPEAQELPQDLQKILDGYKDTPVDEAEFYKKFNSSTIEELKQFVTKGVDEDDYLAADIGLLTSRIIKKVTEYQDKDGKFKTTQALENMTLPKTSQIRAIKKLVIDGAKDEEIKTEIFKIVQLQEKDLTQWEQDLVTEIVKAYVESVDSDTLGNVTDRTPFARYLKN